MKNIFFLLLIALLLIPFSVQGVTVINSKFDTTMKAGSNTNFNMILSPDPGEISVNFETIKITGECAGWVRVNKTSLKFDKSTPVNAVISVPNDATNERHKCEILYTSPASGMLKAAISVPIYVNVIGGKEPTPTPTATPEPIKTTIKPTATRTTVKTPIPTMNAPIAPPDTVSFDLLLAVMGIAVFVAIMFVVVVIYDTRRGKK